MHATLQKGYLLETTRGLREEEDRNIHVRNG